MTSFAALVLMVPLHAQNMVSGEYWLVSDPGIGQARPFTLTGPEDVEGATFDVDLTGITPGLHLMGIRTRDDSARWSITNFGYVQVDAPEEALAEVRHVETFWDADPGFDAGDAHVIDDPSEDLMQRIIGIPVPVGLSVGVHKLFTRSKDANGRWSLTNVRGDVTVELEGSGINESSGFAISTYPNPFTEGITVRTDDGQPLRVVLYDPQGKLVHDRVLNGETYIDLGKHASGTYTAFFWKELERIHRVQLVKH